EFRASPLTVIRSAYAALSTKTLAIYGVLLNLVTKYPLGCIKQFRRTRPVSTRRLKRVLNQILLVCFDRRCQTQSRDRIACCCGLQSRREMMSVNHIPIANQ